MAKAKGLLDELVKAGKAAGKDKPKQKNFLDVLSEREDSAKGVSGVSARQMPRQVETNFSTENVTNKKFMKPILDDLKVDIQRTEYDAPDIYLPDYEGQQMVLSMVDRSPTGSMLYGINDVSFEMPQPIDGGRDFMFNQETNPGLAFANAAGAAQGIANRYGQVKQELLPIGLMEMAHASPDFATFAPGTHIRYAKEAMSPKDRKYVNMLIRGEAANLDPEKFKAVPGFDVDMDSNMIDEYLSTLSGDQRKTISNVFDMVQRVSPNRRKQGVRQVDGALSNIEMRAAVSDPEMFNQLPQMQITNIGLLDGGTAPSPHPTYPVGVTGKPGGRVVIPRDEPLQAYDLVPELMPRSSLGYADAADQFTVRMGNRLARIDDGLLRRLGF